MLFLRIHLDHNTAENGAMEIALKSHCRGSIPANEADRVANNLARELTLAAPGDVLILSMLTLRRSRPSTSDQRRRVLRADYAGFDLPLPLAWAR
ncbi:phytanoyl-CoA dioxygenase family protein [Pseudophaeobacter sp.]|uniref:phytanoyl-CoA dioxygenase family protein n=1 Tax=Pseudophaeobacter sp. TaxID=1971739 RepID=UPI0032975585